MEEELKKILNGTKRDIRNNLKKLASFYKEKTGRVVCLYCPSDVSQMLIILKNTLKMTDFRFKAHNAQYKIKKGDKFTISNATMSNEKALAFLAQNPERIRLFDVFPKNWEELIVEGVKDIKVVDAETLKVNSLDPPVDTAIEKKEATDPAVGEEKKCCEETEGKEPCEKCKEKKKAELLKMSLADLRKAYPEVKATSIKNFVDKILENENTI